MQNITTRQRLFRIIIRIVVYFILYVSLYWFYNVPDPYTKPILVSPIKLYNSINSDFFEILKVDFLSTLLKWMFVFFVGTLSGIFFGIVLGFYKIGEYLKVDIDFWRTLPATILIFYVITLFGDNWFTRIFIPLYVSFFTSLYLISKFTRNNLNRVKISHLKNLGFNNWFIIKNSIFFELLPEIMITTRQVVSLSFLILISTELILGSSDNHGIGDRINFYFGNVEHYDYITLLIIVTGFSGYIANRIMFILGNKIIFWKTYKD